MPCGPDRGVPDVGFAERTCDQKAGPSRAVDRLDSERERSDLGAVNDLEQQLGACVVDTREVEVRREAACVAGAELANRRSALERDPQFEDARLRQVKEQMVLSDIDEPGHVRPSAPDSGGPDAPR